jgi:hypothetical protein
MHRPHRAIARSNPVVRRGERSRVLAQRRAASEIVLRATIRLPLISREGSIITPLAIDLAHSVTPTDHASGHLRLMHMADRPTHPDPTFRPITAGAPTPLVRTDANSRWFRITFVSGGDSYVVRGIHRYDAESQAVIERLRRTGIVTPRLENYTFEDDVRPPAPGEEFTSPTAPAYLAQAPRAD